MALVLKLVIRAGPRLAVLAVAGVVALVAVLTLLAGTWLWQERPRGRGLSLAVQALQLPHLVTAPLSYHFGAPASVAVGLGPDAKPHAFALLRPGLGITWDADPDVSWIGVNLLALFVVAAVVGTWRRAAAAGTAPGAGDAA